MPFLLLFAIILSVKISLVTPAFNSARTIKSAIESVLAQQGADFEYIVIDGASADSTLSIVKEFEPLFSGRMKTLSEPDRGMYDALNKGVSLATGDVVGILNADDLLENPSTLSLVASSFDPSIDAVYADVRFVRDDLLTAVRHYGARHWRPWQLRWGKMPPHPSIYIRRELFERLGPYKTGYEIAADYELAVRYFLKNRIRARYIPATLVKMRMGGKSTRSWRSNLVLNRENVRALRENGYFACFPMMLPKYLFKIWEFILKG